MPSLAQSAQESAFLQFIGLELIDWKGDCAILELTIAPQHLNRHGILHGGVLTTMIDTAGGFAGCYMSDQLPRRAVTLSMTTSFTGQARSGTLRVVGHKRKGSRKIFFSTAEVVDENGITIAFGEGTYSYLGSGGAEG